MTTPDTAAGPLSVDDDGLPLPPRPARPARPAPRPTRLLATLVVFVLVFAVVGVVEATSSANPGAHRTHHYVHGPRVMGTGTGPVYDLHGRVTAASGCGAHAPSVGRPERATLGLVLDHGVLRARIASHSDLPAPYPEFAGQLRADGTFVLHATDSFPADIAPSRLQGRLTDDGAITDARWTFGMPGTGTGNSDDADCAVEVGDLTSSFYFGRAGFDWRAEWLAN